MKYVASYAEAQYLLEEGMLLYIKILLTQTRCTLFRL